MKCSLINEGEAICVNVTFSLWRIINGYNSKDIDAIKLMKMVIHLVRNNRQKISLFVGILLVIVFSINYSGNDFLSYSLTESKGKVKARLLKIFTNKHYEIIRNDNTNYEVILKFVGSKVIEKYEMSKDGSVYTYRRVPNVIEAENVNEHLFLQKKNDHCYLAISISSNIYPDSINTVKVLSICNGEETHSSAKLKVDIQKSFSENDLIFFDLLISNQFDKALTELKIYKKKIGAPNPNGVIDLGSDFSI